MSTARAKATEAMDLVATYLDTHDVDLLDRVQTALDEATALDAGDALVLAARSRLIRHQANTTNRDLLEEAADLAGRADDACAADDPDRPAIEREIVRSFGEWGHELYTRLATNRVVEFPDHALTLLERVVALLPAGATDRPGWTAILANILRSRYLSRRDPADLERSLALYEEVVALAPENSQVLEWKHSLACVYRTRFIRDPAAFPHDLGRAIAILEEVLARLSPDDVLRAEVLTNLAHALYDRSQRFASAETQATDRTIEVAEEALATAPAHLRSGLYVTLAEARLDRYRSDPRHRAADLDRAIDELELAVDSSVPGEREELNRRVTLALALRDRYGARGKAHLDDLDRALEICEDVVARSGDGHPDRASHLGILGVSLLDAGLAGPRPDQLERAVHVLEESLDLVPTLHPTRSYRLNSLASALFHRYEHTHDTADLRRAMQLVLEAVEVDRKLLRDAGLSDRYHADRARFLTLLVNRLVGITGDSRESIDLAVEAVVTWRRVVDDTPVADEELPERLTRLAAVSTVVLAAERRTATPDAIADAERVPVVESAPWRIAREVMARCDPYQTIATAVSFLDGLDAADQGLEADEVLAACVSIVENLNDVARNLPTRRRATTMWAQLPVLGSRLCTMLLERDRHTDAVRMLDLTHTVAIDHLLDLAAERVERLRRSDAEAARSIEQLAQALDEHHEGARFGDDPPEIGPLRQIAERLADVTTSRLDAANIPAAPTIRIDAQRDRGIAFVTVGDRVTLVELPDLTLRWVEQQVTAIDALHDQVRDDLRRIGRGEPPLDPTSCSLLALRQTLRSTMLALGERMWQPILRATGLTGDVCVVAAGNVQRLPITTALLPTKLVGPDGISIRSETFLPRKLRARLVPAAGLASPPTGERRSDDVEALRLAAGRAEFQDAQLDHCAAFCRRTDLRFRTVALRDVVAPEAHQPAFALHVSSHALAHPTDPDASALMDDRRREITFRDILGRDRGHRVVLLPSCSSAAANDALPFEHLSMATAFLLAGSAGCVGALWPLLDSGAEWFCEWFYREYAASGALDDPADAFNDAIISMHDELGRSKDQERFGDDLPTAWRGVPVNGIETITALAYFGV